MSGSNLCFPRSKTARPRSFQKRIIIFCLPFSTSLYLWAIYILSCSVCLFCWSQEGRPILGIYINHSRIHEHRNWEWGRAVSFLGIQHKSDFRYSAVCQGYDMDTEKIKGKGHRNNNMKNWRGQWQSHLEQVTGTFQNKTRSGMGMTTETTP